MDAGPAADHGAARGHQRGAAGDSCLLYPVLYCILYCTVLYCTVQVLVVRDLAPEDAGRYECVASNIGGSVTRFQEVRLKVPSPPPSVYRWSLGENTYI